MNFLKIQIYLYDSSALHEDDHDDNAQCITM